MAADVEAQVRAFITRNFYVAGNAPLTDDASLLDHGIVDSTGVLEVITFLEKTFAIQIDDDEMIPDNLDSIGAIVRFLTRKTATP
jgi:acyl carrier protein